MNTFFKVRDAQAHETGWAYKDEDGQVRLNNEFARIPSGSRLELDDDGYTIKSFVDENKLMLERMEHERRAEMNRQNKVLTEYIGKHVNVSRGIGEIVKVEGTSAITKFESETVRYTLAAITDLEKDNRIF